MGYKEEYEGYEVGMRRGIKRGMSGTRRGKRRGMRRGMRRDRRRRPTEGACSMAVPAMSTRPRTSALRMPSTHPTIRNANYM